MFHELHFALLLSESFQVSASLLDTLRSVGFLSMTTMVDWYLTSECGCYKEPQAVGFNTTLSTAKLLSNNFILMLSA